MNSNATTGHGSNGPDTQTDFTYAFNDKKYSDRVLMIELVPDSPELKAAEDGSNIVVDWGHKLKHRREEIKIRGNGNEEASGNVDSSTSLDSSNPLHVITVHVSSHILAAKSPLFYKLFCGMKDQSEQQHATIQIHVTEVAAVMDLLNFMYSNSLSTKTPTGVFEVLMVADKFEVVSCIRYCSLLLQNLHMTIESALLYLELPSNILMVDEVRSLTDAAKKFLVGLFKDIPRFEEAAMRLPLLGIETILSSDNLQIASEDVVFDFVLKWSRMHYPKVEERREVWTSHLFNLIRFPYMTCRKLKEVITCQCHGFDPELASKLVLEALFYKAEAPDKQRAIAAEAENNALHHRYVERAYKFRPVKALELETPHQQCVIYLDLKRDECDSLFPAGKIYSQVFYLGGQRFFLSARCCMDQQTGLHYFGLFLGIQERGPETFAVDFEFAARRRPHEKYVLKYKGNYTFSSGTVVGCRNLFGVSWTVFLNEHSLFFINGILHLRAMLTLRQ